MAEDSQAAACQKAALQSSSADETETVQGRCKPRTIVHLNPRRLPLPRADDLPVGSGQGSFLGVAYRGDRPSSPWIARLDGHNLGTYRSAYEAALARWVCMHYDRDIVERNGVWYGVAYDHSEGRLVLLTRFTDATEDAVLARIDHHFCLDSSHSEEKATTAKTIGCELSTQEQHELPNTSPTLACVQIPAPTNVCANWSALPAVTDTPLSPPNPRREPLPTQLSTTAGRGQYRGVSMQGNQYVARWKKHHIRSYATAFEAGLAWYIAEHFDRDIESDGAFGYVGRAYQRSVDGGGEVQRFRAVTEGEVIRLIDQFHGIVRTGDACCVEQPVSLDAAIRQYWDWMWETRSERDGLAVCDEMYRAWHSFLVYRPELSHLVRIKCKQWQAAVEACLGLVCVQARYQREEQAMSCEPDARPTSTSSHALKLQWRMVMTATCSVAVCEAAWVRRRTVSVRRSIYRQQAVIQDEMRGRSQLKERFPLWIDHWTPPPLLTEEKLDSAAREQAEAMSDSELDDMARNEPENLAAEKELARRRRLQRINDTTYFG